MNNLRTLSLALAFCTCAISPAQAGMAPDFEDYGDATVGEAMQSVSNPKARSQSAPSYPVSLTGPNRIAVDGKKIVNAIYDNTQMELQSDTMTGQIFVFPKTETPTALFLTTDDRETYALTLIPQATNSQEIVLRGQISPLKATNAHTQKTFSQTVLAAPDVEAQVTRLIRALARNEVPDGFHLTNRCGKDCVRSLSSDSLHGEIIIHRNSSGSAITLEEKLFYRRGVLAVAISETHLAPGKFARVFIVSQKRAQDFLTEVSHD